MTTGDFLVIGVALFGVMVVVIGVTMLVSRIMSRPQRR
jgi:hypothetical protein